MVKKEEVFFIGALGVAGAIALYYFISRGPPTPREMVTINSVEFVPLGAGGELEINSAEFVPTEVINQGTVTINSIEFIPTGPSNSGEITINSIEFNAF